MEDINLKELFRYFLSHFEIVIVILSIFLVFGNLYSLVLKKPMYKSSTTIVLTNGAGQSGSGITQSDIQLNKSLVNTYSEIIKSRKILSQVI